MHAAVPQEQTAVEQMLMAEALRQRQDTQSEHESGFQTSTVGHEANGLPDTYEGTPCLLECSALPSVSPTEGVALH